MREKIREKIELVKNIFEEDPFNLVIGDIEKELEIDTNIKSGPLHDYYVFLSEYSSFRCGSVIIFGKNELDEFQFPVTDMPGDFEEWICIGKIEPYPLFINKKNGQLSCLIGEPGVNLKIECYGEFDDFLEKYVFGEAYVEIAGKDDWYQLLKDHQLI
ncbi:hypothetical protein [Brevibacillus laterosporus]|uniref:hypothetical protein n=1 Tax=Brevibacillus laterosporus TaxID=1465 RepID=UPI002651014D|nr:hypothetical protein [Brevibacillus laterosporus]MDN9008657.1 hypothetical protein [Brevibacillus laterosporus]MDO0939743.1 hypothetical protein [Brevibacillus laterosporus]